MTTRYVNAAETATLIRAALKVAFPGIKFSVRSSTYSMGASVDVKWVDGPTTAMVDAVAKKFNGKGFDGMIDMAYSYTHWLGKDGSVTLANCSGTTGSMGTVEPFTYPAPSPDAVEVLFCVSVSTSRETSAALNNRSLDKVRSRLHLGDIDVSDVIFTEETKRYGKKEYTSVRISRDVYIPGWNAYLSDLVYRDSRKRCAGVFQAR